MPLPWFHYSWSSFLYIKSHRVWWDDGGAGLTGSIWSDNWVTRQQPSSWINCCTELLNSAGAPLSAKSIMPVLCWPAEALQVQMSMFCWELFWVKWFTALRFNLQPSHHSSSSLFSQRSAYFFCDCHSSLHDPLHVACLYFTTIFGSALI